MPAEPMRATAPQVEQPPLPAPEAKPPTTLNEVLTGIPTPEEPPMRETLREAEDRMAREGMAKLNELGKNLNLQASSGSAEFKQETKSVWGRMKERLFKKKDETPVKGEEEIMKEVEKADAVYATFKAKYDEVMAGGDAAGLQSLERSLSQAYEQLAPQVAAEGAAESKAWKKALKTGEAPPVTAAGAKLNDVARRLTEVRARLNGGPKPAPASAPEAAPVREQPPVPTAVSEAPAASVEPSHERSGDTDREFLLEQSAGKPGEKMVDEYLALPIEGFDESGEIVGKSFDPIKGEIRVKYADGSEYRKYSTGRQLRVLSGGKILEGAAAGTPGKKPQAEIVEEPAPPSEEEVFTEAEKAQLLRDGVELARGQAPVSGEIDAEAPAAEVPAEAPAVIVDPEALKMKVVTSSESATASGEIGGERPSAQEPEAEPASLSVEPGPDIETSPAPKEAPPEPVTPENAPVASGEVAAEAKPEAPAAPEAPAMPLEQARKDPLAPGAMPTIITALQGKKFNTPGSLRDAMDEAGFAFPADMEPEDLKRLHDAYKKASRKRS